VTGSEPASLERLFSPRAIALVGVPGDLSRPGARPFHFLRSHGYPGRVYPVNPGHHTIGGVPAYPTLDALPEPPDVAWIGLPAAQAADAVLACGAAHVPFAVVLAAGFAETDAAGAAQQARLADSARRAGVRLVGPNTVGFVNGWDHVALTFSTIGKLEGFVPAPVAILSQSGGLGGCLLDRAAARCLVVGLFVSTGNEADLSLADYLDWLVEDGRARAIACLIEQVRGPDRVRLRWANAWLRSTSIRLSSGPPAPVPLSWTRGSFSMRETHPTPEPDGYLRRALAAGVVGVGPTRGRLRGP
jgi:acyl-CoA synthetase (NDP forming)